MLALSTKLYLRALDMFATPDPKVIFIILIIILNLHDLNVNEFGCNIKPGALDMSLLARSCYKSVIINNNNIMKDLLLYYIINNALSNF